MKQSATDYHTVYEDNARLLSSIATSACYCELEYDNGAVVKKVEMIVFTNSPHKAREVCEEILCKHNDEYIRSYNINRIEIERGSAFIVGGV